MAPAQQRRPGMADVARLAGVSHQTVSRVLNEHPSVKETTRQRVLDAIDELQYRRNRLARALVTRRSQMLGVVAVGTDFYGPASTLGGIQQAARAAGYFVTVVELEVIDEGTVVAAADVLSEHSPEGLLVIAPLRSAVEAIDRIPADLPTLAVGGGEGTERTPVVHVDQHEGARIATQHLLDLGHATVHHVAGPPEWLEADARLQGWRGCLDAAGAPGSEPVRGDWSARSGYEAGRRLLQTDDVTAVFVANDQMTLGLLRALREEDIAVPGDVSVVGFDDVPEAEFFPPPLTTIRQDFKALGRLSIEVILRMVEGRADPGRHVVIAPELVIRSTTAAPAGGPDVAGSSAPPADVPLLDDDWKG